MTITLTANGPLPAQHERWRTQLDRLRRSQAKNQKKLLIERAIRTARKCELSDQFRSHLIRRFQLREERLRHFWHFPPRLNARWTQFCLYPYMIQRRMAAYARTFRSPNPHIRGRGYLQQASHFAGLLFQNAYPQKMTNTLNPNLAPRSFITPMDEQLESRFQEYWRRTDARPETKRQVDFIKTHLSETFWQRFELQKDRLRRSLFIAGEELFYFNRPDPITLVTYLKEVARCELRGYSPEVTELGARLDALFVLTRINHATSLVSSRTGHILGVRYGWLPRVCDAMSVGLSRWTRLVQETRQALLASEEGRACLARVNARARLRERGYEVAQKDVLRRTPHRPETPILFPVWVNPAFIHMDLTRSLHNVFEWTARRARFSSFYLIMESAVLPPFYQKKDYEMVARLDDGLLARRAIESPLSEDDFTPRIYGRPIRRAHVLHPTRSMRPKRFPVHWGLLDVEANINRTIYTQQRLHYHLFGKRRMYKNPFTHAQYYAHISHEDFEKSLEWDHEEAKKQKA